MPLNPIELSVLTPLDRYSDPLEARLRYAFGGGDVEYQNITSSFIATGPPGSGPRIQITPTGQTFFSPAGRAFGANPEVIGWERDGTSDSIPFAYVGGYWSTDADAIRDIRMYALRETTASYVRARMDVLDTDGSVLDALVLQHPKAGAEDHGLEYINADGTISFGINAGDITPAFPYTSFLDGIVRFTGPGIVYESGFTLLFSGIVSGAQPFLTAAWPAFDTDVGKPNVLLTAQDTQQLRWGYAAHTRDYGTCIVEVVNFAGSTQSARFVGIPIIA